MKQKTFILSKKKSFTAFAISCCMFSVRIRDSSALSEIRPFNLKNQAYSILKLSRTHVIFKLYEKYINFFPNFFIDYWL